MIYSSGSRLTVAERSQDMSETESNRESELDSSISETDEVDFCVSDSEDYGDYADCIIHPALMDDIRLLKENCPYSSVSHRSLNQISEIDLDISFTTKHLEKTVAEAWGLVYGEPVVIRLCLDQQWYLDADDVGIVEVFQKGYSKKSIARMQLKIIAEEFCRKQFRELTNEKVQAAVMEKMQPSQGHPNHNEILELLEMGFRHEDIVQAYTFSNGMKEGAVNFLLEEKVLYKEVVSCEPQSISPLPPHESKQIPSLDKGFLVQFYLYIEQRLLTLNSFCPICDNPHSSAISIMLKPVVCSNPLCIFSYQTLGVMADAVDTIVSDAEVVNLLIHLTKAAVSSSRRNLILTPYPTVVHPSEVREMALHPEKKDFVLLECVCSKMSSVQDMLKHDEAGLKTMLSQKHELCYPLLKWIISSNRSHIVKLSPTMQLPFMGTRHQFIMRNSPPLEDRQFRMHRQKYGSVFAFHGSPIENWHSIVREGLIVASKTEKMIHGCAYGKGIYLSPHLGTSLSYCRSLARDCTKKGKTDEKLSHEYIQGSPESLTCITLCEVIDCPSLRKFSNIWTCNQSEYVCTRFFFVYDRYNLTAAAVQGILTTDKRIRQQIELAISSA